jgi:hypothetical protein
MSIEDADRAEVSLSLLAGLECEFDGGPIGRDGHCSVRWHAHCPFCGQCLGCKHEVGKWDDSFGYSGPEFPGPPTSDAAICAAPPEEVRALLGELAPLWDIYLGHVDFYLAPVDLAGDVATLLTLPVVAVDWLQDESPAGGVGETYFALNPAEVVATLESVAARIQAVFDRFDAPAEREPADLP